MSISVLKHIVKHFVCWILLFQIINISIDPPDIKQIKGVNNSNKEDLSINEMESLYELVLEKLFEKDVPESDENEIDTNVETFDLFCFTNGSNEDPVFYLFVEYFSVLQSNLPYVHSEPNFPPPKII